MENDQSLSILMAKKTLSIRFSLVGLGFQAGDCEMNARIYFLRRNTEMDYHETDEAGRREDRASRIVDSWFRLE